MRDLIKMVKNKYNYPLTIAEIGVEKGVHALELLYDLNIQHLYLIDHYLTYKDGLTNCSQEIQDDVYKIMFKRLNPFREKISFITKPSVFASSLFSDEYFDFVYIDSNHDYEFVIQDINMWWPKVKKDGILGGHDYKWTLNVERAVREFAKNNSLNILEFLEDSRNTEWGFIKQ